MAALAVTMTATDFSLRIVAGHGGPWNLRDRRAGDGVAAAATYYVVNSGVVAGALAAAGKPAVHPRCGCGTC